MLLLVIRKMLNNKWMMACLLIGSVLAVAMVSSIPIYTDGVLQRMMIKDLEQYQLTNKIHSGKYQLSGNLYYVKSAQRLDRYKQMDAQLQTEYVGGLPISYITRYHQITVDYVDGLRDDMDPEAKGVQRKYIRLEGLQGYRDKIKITHGRMPSTEVVDGVYECAVTEGEIKRLGVKLNETYIMRDVSKRRATQFTIRVVGVFDMADATDPFWYAGLSRFNEGVLMDFDLLMRDFIDGENTLITNALWYYALDYHKLTLDNMPVVYNALSSQMDYIKKGTQFDFTVTMLPTLKLYVDREATLRTTLWVLQVPILMMLAFYIYMVAQLIIDYEKNEIAVIKSRGASRSQVLTLYLLQSLIINLIALGIGPFLGLQLCKLLGASNGFLEFVQRTALPLEVRPKAYQYSMLAIAFSMLTMLLPAMLSSRRTIVEVKRRKSRLGSALAWVKLLLALAAVGVSLYGQSAYQTRSLTLAASGMEGLEVPIDPLLFLMSTLFIVGCGLLLLYIYPYFVRLVFFLGRRFWSPALYASFIQVGRSGGQEQFLMLFLVLTLSVGIFSANAARTINLNTEEKIMYRNGADIVLVTEWQSNKPPEAMPGPGSMPEPTTSSSTPVIYKEPPFEQYRNIAGVDKIARVYRNADVVANIPGASRSVKLEYMAVKPIEFGETTWSRPDLLPYHINYYLNTLTNYPNAVFVSTNFQTEFNVKQGDVLYMSWSQQNMTVQVAGFIPFWPSLNPYERKNNADTKFYVVGNMDYLNARTALEPYQVWIKRTPEATSQMIYDDIAEKKLSVVKILDSRQDIIKQKNDPMLQGLNGAMTMGFIVTMLVSAIGFIIYWILSIKARVLQFGIFRAIGLKMRKIISMLVCEQILISFVAILAGIVIGGATCDMYVPMLEIAYSSAQQVPKFKVVAFPLDYQRIYIIVGAMLLIGFVTLGAMISRIKMSQAIKLGED